MILVNFAHSMTQEHIPQNKVLTGRKVDLLVEIPARLICRNPLGMQIVAMAEAADLTPQQQWKTESILSNLIILINLPFLNYSTVLLIAELRGRMGYFPPCVRLRPVKDALPPRYEPAEVLNLQAVGDAARRKRN